MRLKCAVAWQTHLAEQETEKELIFRIGVNLGDIVIDGDDILGDGVNVAARLEGLAEPGGIVVSDMVHQNVKAKLDFGFNDHGNSRAQEYRGAGPRLDLDRRRVGDWRCKCLAATS